MKSVGQFTNSYFLDTSTHINRHWADEQIQRGIQADLCQKKLYGSVYVECQYRYIILKTFAVIYNECVKEQDKDKAEERIDKLRQQKILDDLPYRVARRYFKQYDTIKPILMRLRRLIKKDWEYYFYDGLTKPLCDLTSCKRAMKDIEKSGDYYIPPSSECPSTCQPEVFWKSKNHDLNKLSQINPDEFNKINDPKGTMRKIQSVAERILHGEPSRGKLCQAISDAIISIEARDSYPGTPVHTTDYDFTLLCPILDVPFKYFNINTIV